MTDFIAPEFDELDYMTAADLSSDAVVNPGWHGYAFGVGGDNSMIIDEGPNSVIGKSLVDWMNAPDRWNPYAGQTARENPPPLLLDGSAQRAHPNQLALAEFTPIGTGEIHLKDISPCLGATALYDIETWNTGIGQIANAVALVYGAAQNEGSGAAAGAAINQVPYVLPSDLSVGYVASDAPNAQGVDITEFGA